MIQNHDSAFRLADVIQPGTGPYDATNSVRSSWFDHQ
jgi:hypothetical protein